jgi:hypothetical protein
VRVRSVHGDGVVVDGFEVVLEKLEEAPRIEASKCTVGDMKTV